MALDSALSLPPDVLALLFGVGVLAGFVDSIAGGGGLLTVPALLWVGLPPAAALATNKLQSSFGSFSAAARFWRSGHVELRVMGPMIGATFVGGAAGALSVQAIDPGFLRQVIPVLLIAVALYFVFQPRLGVVDSHRRMSEPAFAILAGGGIGFYDGFFGPGTGTFFAVAFVFLLGFNLLKATAHAKVLNLTSNAAGLLFFLLGGQIAWMAGLAMGVGQYLGAQIGAHLVVRNGARIVRPVLILASLAITAKLIVSDPDHALARWVEWVMGWV